MASCAHDAIARAPATAADDADAAARDPHARGWSAGARVDELLAAPWPAPLLASIATACGELALSAPRRAVLRHKLHRLTAPALESQRSSHQRAELQPQLLGLAKQVEGEPPESRHVRRNGAASLQE